MTGSVDIEQLLLVENPIGLGHGADHFVIDGAFFFEAQFVIARIFGYAEVADFGGSDFFVGVVGMQQRIELYAESVVENIEPRFGIEVCNRCAIAW